MSLRLLGSWSCRTAAARSTLLLLAFAGCGSRIPVKVTQLGGSESHWETEQSTGSGIHNLNPIALYRRVGAQRELVREGVHLPTYIGEDCVLFQVFHPATTWMAACDEKEERALTDQWGSRWEVRGEALVKTLLPNDGPREIVTSLSFAEIRALAQGQPPREPAASLSP